MTAPAVSFAASAVLTLAGLAAIALSAAPLGAGPQATPWPALLPAVVFFALAHRPGALPVPLVLALGLSRDLVMTDVVGAGAAPLVVASLALRGGIASLGPAPPPWRWAGFAVFAALVVFGEWALTGLARFQAPPPGPVFAHYLVTVAAYPLVSATFRRILRFGRTRRP